MRKRCPGHTQRCRSHAGFAELKTFLRKADERTVEGMWTRIGKLLDRFTPGECARYFRNARYGSSKVGKALA